MKDWIKKNSKSLIFGLGGLIIGILIMLIMWPERIAKLENGTEPVVTYKGTTITADDLYTELKDSYGISKLLDIVDKDLLDQEYDLDEEAEEYAKTTSENYYTQYESYYGYTKDQFLSSNGFDNEQEFLDYLEFDYLCNTWYEDYLKSIITDKEIETFYKKEAFGEKTVTFYSATSDDNNLENVRKALKAGKDVSEYDDVTVNELTIGNADIDTYSSTIIKAIKGLKKGEYTKVLDDDTYGHLVVYVKSSTDLGSLDDEKESIIKALSTRKTNDDSGLYYRSFDVLRKKYDLKFEDTNLEKAYKEYMKQYE